MIKNSSDNQKKTLMRKLQVYGFALYDTILFLDSHPEDNGALDFYDKMSAAYNKTKKLYEEQFGPLTVNSVDTDNGWTWTEKPWPWEFDAN